jgi:intein-encoded DNA endonuclease-like protein
MSLKQQAEGERERRSRSRLEPHREAILTLRKKHWSYRQIAQWLKERGVTISHPAVFHFCERNLARRPRHTEVTAEPIPKPLEGRPLSIPKPQTIETKTEPTKHRFNLPDSI